MERLRLVVHGMVQGVGFRAFARREALRLGLTGWVCNRADGSVEAEAEGPPAALDGFLAALARGPRCAVVERVEVSERLAMTQPAHPGFAITGW